jgi:hypothetical protein
MTPCAAMPPGKEKAPHCWGAKFLERTNVRCRGMLRQLSVVFRFDLLIPQREG